MKDVTDFICTEEGRNAHIIGAHAEGEYYGQTISIDGGRWEVEIDTFLDKNEFPASYHGEVCDISIRTGSVSIDFFMAIGNVIKLNESIKIIIDHLERKGFTLKQLDIEERGFSIANITINGKWYSVGDLTLVQRTPLKAYVSFTEKSDTETDIDEDDVLSYDLVCKYEDIKDITDRIIRNYKSLKRSIGLD